MTNCEKACWFGYSLTALHIAFSPNKINLPVAHHSSTRRAQSRQTATALRPISSLTHAKEIKCERILAIRSAVVLAMQQYDFLVCSELLTGFHRTRERTGIAIADSLCRQLWKTP